MYFWEYRYFLFNVIIRPSEIHNIKKFNELKNFLKVISQAVWNTQKPLKISGDNVKEYLGH